MRTDPRAYDGPQTVAAPIAARPVVVVDPASTPPGPARPRTTVTRPRIRPSPTPPPEATPPRAEPFRTVRMRPAVDIGITLGAAAPSLALGLWVTPSLPGPLVQPGAADEIGRFDRSALGRYATGPDTASDILLGVGVAVPVVYHGIEAALHRRGFSRARGRGFVRRYGTDLVLYGQALAINGLVTEILKAAIRRPRPFTYLDPDDVDPSLRDELVREQTSTGADWSFPSGHTSTVFTATTAGATLLTLELLGRANWAVALAWVGGAGVATTTGVMRVLAGRHFPSDVVTSALIGTAVGVVVPLAHWRPATAGDMGRRGRARRWAVGAMSGPGLAGLQVRGAFR